MITQKINVDYNEAIQYYFKQKQLFLQYYKELANITSQDIEEQFINNFSIELEQESIEEEFFKAKVLFQDLGEAFSNKEILKYYRQQAKELASEKQLEAQNILKKITNDLVDTVEFKNIVKSAISNYGEGFCSTDILKVSRSYVKALVQQRIINNGTHNPKITARAKIAKGYFREGLVFKSFQKIFEQGLQKNLVEISPMGAKNTAIDTLIKFNDISFQDKVLINLTDNNFGLQSKSWIEPWLQDGYYQSISNKAAIIYSVGNRAQLLQGLENKHSWIAGVNYLGQTSNIKAALGELNTLYLTGKNLYFTADLISQMRARAYYLAFVFDPKTYSATKEITWQTKMAQVRWIQFIKKKKLTK